MASRIMHYLIANEINNKYKVKDLNRFLIGSLAPDMSSHEDKSYDNAHYGEILSKEQIKGINWMRFADKYNDKILNDDIYLGYYCHLITDAVWFKTMVDKYIRIYPKSERKKYINMGYKDFQKLNSLLIKRYNLKNTIESIKLPDIDEVDNIKIIELMKGLEEDFQTTEDFKNIELEIYPFDDIIQFIKNSTTLCIMEINALIEKVEHTNPIIYYTGKRP